MGKIGDTNVVFATVSNLVHQDPGVGFVQEAEPCRKVFDFQIR